VVWHVPGEHRMAGTIEGRQALLAWLAEVGNIGFWLVEHDVFARGRRSSVCVHRDAE